MRIGVRAHDLGKLRATALAERIAHMGLACVQLTLPEAIEGFTGGAGRLNPGIAYEIGAAFRSSGVQIAVLSCYINPIHPDEAERKRQLELFKEHLRFVRDFGCGIVATETGSLNPDLSFHPGNHSEQSFQLMLRSVGELVAEAERFGVLVAIEGVAKFVASDPQRIRRMLDSIASNNVQVLFDAANLLSAENFASRDEIVRESFELFADRIVVVHAKDCVLEAGRKKSVPLGKGLMDYRQLLGLLKARKPMIPVIIEDSKPQTIHDEMGFLKRTFEAL